MTTLNASAKLTTLFTFAAVALFASTSNAANIVVNGSFEDVSGFNEQAGGFGDTFSRH